jgi:hypothetical protein
MTTAKPHMKRIRNKLTAAAAACPPTPATETR